MGESVGTKGVGLGSTGDVGLGSIGVVGLGTIVGVADSPHNEQAARASSVISEKIVNAYSLFYPDIMFTSQ